MNRVGPETMYELKLVRELEESGRYREALGLLSPLMERPPAFWMFSGMLIEESSWGPGTGTAATTDIPCRLSPTRRSLLRFPEITGRQRSQAGWARLHNLERARLLRG